MTFDPAVELDKLTRKMPAPLQRISVLKPGQAISSYLTDYAKLKGKRFDVAISWSRQANSRAREENRYILDMADMEGLNRLGNDPLVQIASQIKHIREDWRSVASGGKRTSVDVFSASDRLHEQRERERLRRRWTEEENQSEATLTNQSDQEREN